MHDDSLVTDAGFDLVTVLFFRPFAKGTTLAYELVLRRSSGDRCYDRSICYLSGTDARDIVNACPSISFEPAR